MGNRAKVWLLLICLATGSLRAELRKSFLRTEGDTSPGPPSGKLPFRLVRSSLILVKGNLNGVSATLLVDTGSRSTVLDVAMAQRLGIAGTINDVVTLDGVLPGMAGILNSLNMGPISVQSVPVVVADLSFIKNDLGENIDAVIGFNILKTSFTIDYEAKRIVLGPVPAYRDWVPFADGPPMVTVEMQIEGEPKCLLVDTGADGLFVFQNQARQPQLTGLRKQSNLTASRSREQVEIPDLQLGRLRRTRQPAYLIRPQEQLPIKFDGLLGPPALGIRRLAFDLERGRLGWK